jgi:hypothetical protein
MNIIKYILKYFQDENHDELYLVHEFLKIYRLKYFKCSNLFLQLILLKLLFK